MARFQETINIRPISAVTPQVGAGNASLALADKLEQFKSTALKFAGQEAIQRGKETASQVRLKKEGGVTKTPEFKEAGLFGRVEALAHNKSLKAAYVASLDSDIKTNVARIQNENSSDLVSFNEAAEGFRKGVIQSVDPSIRQSAEIALEERIGASRQRVQTATMEKQREAAKQTLLIHETTLFDDAVLSARNGDIRQSAVSIADYFTNIDAQVESGFITQAAGEEKKRTVELESANQNLIGQVRQKTSRGDFQGVLVDLEKLREKVSAGRSVEEHEELLSALTSEVTESLNIRNKIESLEAEEVDQKQVNNFNSLFTGIVDPLNSTTNVSDITRNLNSGNLTETQATQLVNVLNNRGLGVDDFSLINSINTEIRANGNADGIRSSIIQNSGTKLTEQTATGLLAKVDEMVSGESILFTNKSKRAQDFIRKKFGFTGPLSSLDFDKSKRLADAEREYSERVIGGEDPFLVADQLIGKEEFNLAPDPKFGTKEDLQGSVDLLNTQFDAGNVDDDTYNFEMENLLQLKELKENIKLFDMAKKEQDGQ